MRVPLCSQRVEWFPEGLAPWHVKVTLSNVRTLLPRGSETTTAFGRSAEEPREGGLGQGGGASYTGIPGEAQNQREPTLATVPWSVTQT